LAPTITETFTPTPDQPLSGMGHPVLGPVPVPRGGTCYIFPDKPITACNLDIFDLVGEIEAHVAYSGSGEPVWNTGNIAPGIYVAVIKTNYVDGTTGTTTQKIVISR
jgi:hypothetical protein